ncbi:phosphoinositide 3-kinase regulatory subunit 6-like isoform X2 [Polyodon spathula]|nr:phosphoinositide 3-kinase regulatory subunit 6-like isoform X2 [Polyodon spathula]XP_041075537.1 phosphoinositide 3-kinase regulatory subunit 6-like isoform X2 [Polyodon spathula]XP_041075538.1 phosphoinositide 3-kinase regulatory subunit 6-like isoform X2 [Polyodon spathula]
MESDLLRSVHSILLELDGHHTASQFNRGMLRWTLHKKIERNPTNNSTLVEIAVKELERAERSDNKLHIIPLLHTLMYAIVQAVYIPDDLYKRAYEFCKRLLTLPQPYCTVGLSHAVRVKSERLTPGVLFQRMVLSEQNIKNELYQYHEKVFVFADPALLSMEMSAALSSEIESASPCRSHMSYMCDVIVHTMQAALGDSCDAPALEHMLKAKGQDTIELCFREVVANVEVCAEEAGGNHSLYTGRLQQLYRTIISSANPDGQSSSTLFGIPLPNPEISFHLWREDDFLWKELAKFTRSASSSDSVQFEMPDPISDLTSSELLRLSILSTDSGIERDLLLSELPAVSEEPSAGRSEQEQGRLFRRGGFKMKPSVSDGMALLQDTLEETSANPPGKLQRRARSHGLPGGKQQKLYTARIVVVGDDRIVGRLAKAYYSLRKRDARRPFLTQKLSLQIYYVPVTQEEYSFTKENTVGSDLCQLAAYLGRVDPWYENTIRSLCHIIPKLAKMKSCSGKSLEANSFLTDVISYYVRMGGQPVHFCIYSVKITFTCLTKENVEDVFVTQLQIDIPECMKFSGTMKGSNCGAMMTISYKKASLSNREVEKALSLRTSGLVLRAIPSCETEDLDCLTVSFSEGSKAKTGVDSKIRTCNIKIRTLEQKPFTVCLDQDYRRIFKNVASIEVSPCLEPGYVMQKMQNSRFSVSDQEDVGLTKYMSKVLPLPINTFAGIIQ